MSPQLVVVASENPVKIASVILGFEQVFPKQEFTFLSRKVHSGVGEQPFSDEETLRGAMNRVLQVEKLVPNADYYVALEGGAEEVAGELHEFGWIVVKNRYGRSGKGKSCTFITPEIFLTYVREGLEIGEICDKLFEKTNSKQDIGAIGLLTNGVIDRKEQYRHAVVLALIPFVQPLLY